MFLFTDWDNVLFWLGVKGFNETVRKPSYFVRFGQIQRIVSSCSSIQWIFNHESARGSELYADFATSFVALAFHMTRTFLFMALSLFLSTVTVPWNFTPALMVSRTPSHLSKLTRVFFHKILFCFRDAVAEALFCAREGGLRAKKMICIEIVQSRFN